MKKLELILMPDDDFGNAYSLEFYTPDGVWLAVVYRTKRVSFAESFERQACQWKKGDPDIYAEMMAGCVLADKQVA